MSDKNKKMPAENSYDNRKSTVILLWSFAIHLLVVIFFWDLSSLPTLEQNPNEAVWGFLGIYLSIIVAMIPSAVIAAVFYLYPDDSGFSRAYRVFSIVFLIAVLITGFGAII